MDLWFLKDPQRLLYEREKIAELQVQSAWLFGVAWVLEDTKIHCDVTIRAHGYDYEVRMTYPAFFPDTPPSVAPREAARWSLHQYGVGGTLCLEWGPDNWQPEVTGAQLLESTFRLLYQENPLGNADTPFQEVLSRHALTLGQELRFSIARSFVSNEFLQRANDLPAGGYAEVEVADHRLADQYVSYPISIRAANEQTAWQDSTLPAGLRLRQKSISPGFILKVALSSEQLERIVTAEDLLVILRQAGYESWPHTPHAGFEIIKALVYALLVSETGQLHQYLLFKRDDGLRLVSVAQIPDDRDTRRLPECFVQLAEVSVAVVGAGSLGSKVTVSLARAGVRNFFILDDDVMLPGNVQRHATDWEAVGFQKGEALAEKVRRIAPDMIVETRNVRLAGQESSSVVAGVLEKLAQYSLIVDATADPQVFNLLGTLAHRARVPLVWGMAYAGGLGGLVARSRPGLDPDPIAMRAAYLNYCKEHEVEADDLVEGHDYGTGGAGGQPMVASDADVSVIAHHVARLVLDALTNGERSDFPKSLYLIGLREGWVFEMPFQNIAITVGKPLATREEAPPYEALSTDDKQAFTAFLQELVFQNKRGKDETATAE